MRHAMAIAERGRGDVEPNPVVGAVLVDDELNFIAEGYHQKFGGPHAEVHAIRAAGNRSKGATMFVTLEPCSHQGNTPPCADAVITVGITRVVIAMQDPAKHVDGGGIARLKEAGVEVDVGLLEDEARRLIAPFIKRVTTDLPYVHAKWAMTLDGKIATHIGSSQWISNERSRAVVHELRGRMDAIIVGIGTALTDDPLLTARPPGPRTALRVVLDRRARLPLESQLIRTIDEAPLLVVTSNGAAAHCIDALRDAGAEVWIPPDEGAQGEGAQGDALVMMLRELAQREMTNVLIEGGGHVLGACFDARLVDEAHIFIAPKLVGGSGPSPVAGTGIADMSDAIHVETFSISELDGDVYMRIGLEGEHGVSTL